MKIGVRCNPLHLKSDFPALAHWLAENDFDSVDLMDVDADALAAATQAGLVPGSFDAPSLAATLSPDEAQRAKAVADLKTDLAKAADLGLKTLFACFVPPAQDKSKAENFEIWKSVYVELVPYAENLGLCIAMEPYPGPPPHYPTLGVTPEHWRAMFEAVPSPALGICYDPSHMVRLGIDYMRVLDEFGDRVHHVHAKDCAMLPESQYLQGRLPLSFGRPEHRCSEGWWRYCIPGAGEVDWTAVVAKLAALGYDNAYSIELEDHFYMDDADGNKRGLTAARNFLRALP